jgi:hypothetical protein
MMEMEYAFNKIPHSWRAMITKDTWKERKTMVCSQKRIKLNRQMGLISNLDFFISHYTSFGL